MGINQQTQNNCITFAQRRPNVFAVAPTLYTCHTNGLSLLGIGLIRLIATAFTMFIVRSISVSAYIALVRKTMIVFRAISKCDIFNAIYAIYPNAISQCDIPNAIYAIWTNAISKCDISNVISQCDIDDLYGILPPNFNNN